MKMLYLADIRLPTEKAHGLQIMKTCEAFASAGHKVTLVVPWRRNALSDDPFEYYQCKNNFRIVRIFSIDVPLGKFGYLLERFVFAVSASLYVALHRSDIVYSREAFIFALMNVPWVRFVWESHTGEWDWAARATARAAFRVVVLTHAAKNWYVGKGIDARKLVVAPDGIDLAQFAHPESKSAARTRLGLPQDKKIALYIGRVDGWKGIETFAEAAKLAPEILFVAIGGEREQVEAFRTHYPTVTWLGYRPYAQLANNQAAADCLVLPNTAKDQISLIFTSPLKLFTYMASLRPIVASDVPSIREVLDDSSCYFVTPDSPESLAQGIQNALTDDSESRARAERALAKVRAYSWDERVRAILHALV